MADTDKDGYGDAYPIDDVERGVTAWTQIMRHSQALQRQIL